MLAAVLAGGLLTACGSTVVVEPAPQATSADCSTVLAALTRADDLDGRPRREVSTQGAAAWGDPPVVMRCGVEPPGPSTDTCVEVGGVDWVSQVDPLSQDAVYTTYGRTPAVQVLVPGESGSGLDTVLAEISGPVAALEQTRRCY